MGNLKDINYGVGKYLTVDDASSLPDIATNRVNLDTLNFKLAANNAYTLYNMKDGFIEAFEDTSGVDASASTNETRDSSGKYYSGSSAGTISAFTSTGAATWTAPTTGDAEILVVAGGGGGANGYYGGAGGAGGVVHASAYPVTANVVYDLSVGAGGSGGNPQAGSNSVFNINGEGNNTTVLTANGGGRGGGGGQPAAGGSGGSGGGTDNDASSGGSSNQPASFGTPQVATGYGSAGGGVGGNSGAGGGGANAAGQGSNGNTGGNGGAGKLFSTFVAYGTTSANAASSGSNGGYFGGGGGGAAYNSPGAGHSGGAGGVGGGGKGQGQTSDAAAGLANTGGGGGAQSVQGSGGGGRPGGSGVVLIKSADAYQNMTVVSNAQTAQAQSDTARIILDEESYAGATTLNTDIKAYASRDNGTTYTQVTLAEQGQLNYLAGIDQYTKLMLHCDGSDSGTTFTDSSATGHTMTASGNAHTDTTIKKFGTASAQFDGTGDYITSAASTEFSLTGDFTIDCWCYFSAINTTIANSQANADWNSASTNDWILLVDGGGNVTFNVKGVGAISSAGHGALSAWKHIAVERASGTSKLYVDGALTATSTGPGSGTISTNNIVTLGRASTNLTTAYNGYIDEFRISKGIARYGAAFTPAATPYEHSRRLLSGSVDISGQPSGTNMKYKIETLNQSAAKQTRIYGTSMAWA